MLFAARVDEAFADVEHKYQSQREVKDAKKRIRERFRQAAEHLDRSYDVQNWPVEKVMYSIANEALQSLACNDWFDQVDWAKILCGFITQLKAGGWQRSDEELDLLAVRVVQRWQEDQKEKKLLLFGDRGAGEQIKELFSKHSFGVPAKTRAPLHLDSGYVAGLNSKEPRGAPEAREIDIDLGFFAEVEPLGVSLQGLRVEQTGSGRAQNLLMPGDVVTSVNGTVVASHQDFWREVEHAKPGHLRVCVLPSPGAQDRPKRAEKLGGATGGLPRPRKAPPEVDPKADLIEVDPKVVEVDPKVAETLPARRDGDKAMIVLNCEDIGASFFKCTSLKGDQGRLRPFPWDAVRCAIKFYEELGFMPQPVCHQATMARHPPPEKLREKLVQCPVVDDDGRLQGRGSDRIFVITLAATYDCPFVDNSNYREQVWNGHELWPWLQQEGLALKVEYIFDSFGEFLPSREVMPRTTGSLWIPWTEYGGR